MYFRRKTSAGRAYLQIVESRRDGDQVRQQVIATLGRFDELQASGQLERLVRSGARFAAKAMVLSAASNDAAIKIAVRRIGPALVFERLWEETGCRAVIAELAGKRKHGFALERAVFLTVLHRLFVSGSDRAADRWREDYAIAGVEGLDLHHLYRAMAWLGEELPEKEQDGRTPFAPRCLKDVVEERLFAHRRDLLTRLDLVFMDTTSLYFEGAGGQTLGQHGYSKDHRPDLRQMILAVLIDGDGRPVCSEMWPGNTADVTTLIPVIDRLRRRFDIARVCVVADRGMISAETMAELEARRLLYILGVRERSDKLVRELVLDDPAPFVPLVMKKRGKAMLCYKQLWTVEQTFRTAKHLFSTRPIFHKLDETIRGHVFCSFLALVLKKALEDRIAALGHSGSWPEKPSAALVSGGTGAWPRAIATLP